MRIPSALRSQPWDLGNSYHWEMESELSIVVNGQSWQVHSKWAHIYETRPAIPQGIECIVCIGLGQGFHLCDWANQTDTIVLIDFDFSQSQGAIEQLRQNHRGEIHLLDLKSSSEQWNQVSKLVQNCVHLNYVKPIYKAFARTWVQQILSFLIPQVPTLASKTHLGLLQGQHFLTGELSKVLKSQSMPCFQFVGDQISASQFWDFELWLKNEKPSAVLSINMKGLDSQGEIAALLKRYGVELVIWFVDDPRPIWSAFQGIDLRRTTVYTWETAYLSWLKSLKLKYVDYLPLAADSSRFTPLRTHLNTQSAFVGSAMSGAFLNNIVQKAQLQSSLTYVSVLLEQYKQSRTFADLTQLIGALNLEPKKSIWLESLVLHSYSAQKRQSLAKCILKLGAKIYGDAEEWKQQFPQWQSQILHELSYPQETDLIYSAHSFQFNSTSAQMPTAVNQRVFDVPSRGSFLITDAQSDLESLFEEGSFATYQNVEEVPLIWQEYSQDLDRCRKMLETQRQVIVAMHCYEHRVQKIVKDLNS